MVIITRSFAYQFQSLAAESHLQLLVHLITGEILFSNSFWPVWTQRQKIPRGWNVWTNVTVSYQEIVI